MRIKQVKKATIIQGGVDNADTHSTKWFKHIWRELDLAPDRVLVDPFARDCELAYPYTNDLNPNTKANFNMCAFEFLDSLERNFADLIIFDPPFSERMANDHYEGYGVNLYVSDNALMTSCLNECANVLKPNGLLLKFGHNINRPSKHFELVELWMLEKNGHKTTTMITLWRNVQHTLY